MIIPRVRIYRWGQLVILWSLTLQKKQMMQKYFLFDADMITDVHKLTIYAYQQCWLSEVWWQVWW